jgi:hypothetical protein
MAQTRVRWVRVTFTRTKTTSTRSQNGSPLLARSLPLLIFFPSPPHPKSVTQPYPQLQNSSARRLCCPFQSGQRRGSRAPGCVA